MFDSSPGGGEHVDKSKVLNLFENPIAADLDGQPGLEVMRGGLTLNGLVNLGIAVGQNLPYNHVMQAWSGATGQSLPAYPQAVEDYQLLSSPSVADVSDAPGKELLVGTGLYLLRNLNATGVEGAGFPKFTGGWIFAVPAIGDIDGDGKLDIATLTREGNAFAWKTGLAGLRHQRRVVDLAPRRALDRCARDRHAAAGGGGEDRVRRPAAELDRAGRRLAVRGAQPRARADRRHPDRRGGGRLGPRR